ncbi:MAG TPA: sensor domain-containing diguanylate cyclase [Terriglobales bacterium]|nr:sensor domain-containing diguanylate cyclase [Terriglobales bacterium]
MPVGERQRESQLGWKDSQACLIAVVLTMIACHAVADAVLPRYFDSTLSGLVVGIILSVCAVWFSTSLLMAHRSVQRDLHEAVQDKVVLHEETSTLLHQLHDSLADTERHNEQLRLLGAFNQRIHACENEQQILEVVEKSLPGILQCTSGALYCPTPEGDFRRVVRWPEGRPSESSIRRDRCEALRKISRIEGEHAPCHGCKLPDPQRVACVPLRFGRKTAGLLQLTFANPRGRATRNSAENFITQMAADQLSLALLNAIARKDLGDKVMKDGLTGIFNRRYMEEALQREIARSVRNKTPLSVLMVDLDHFKQLNDTKGHAAGDLVLKELAKTLTANVRPSDIVCRYGGEEFLIAFPDISSVAAKGRADELRRKIHEISKLVKHHRVISASIGIAAMPEHGSDLKTLLRAADDALYEAKHSGRDRAVIATSMKIRVFSNHVS